MKLCAKFGKNWPSGAGEEDEYKTERRTDGLTDRRAGAGQKVIMHKNHLSFSVQMS